MVDHAASGVIRTTAMRLKSCQCFNPKIAKRDEPPLLLVPQRKGRASQTLEKSRAPLARQLRVITDNLRQAVEGDTAG